MRRRGQVVRPLALRGLALRRAVAIAAVLMLLAPGALAQQTPPAAAAPPPAALPVVTVRGGVHDDYARLVFDWPRGVDFRLSQTGNRVTVYFNRPAQLDLNPARAVVGSRIQSLAQGQETEGSEVSFIIPPGAVLKSFNLGTRIVVDVKDAAAPATQANQPAQTAQTPPPPAAGAQRPPTQAAAPTSAAPTSAAPPSTAPPTTARTATPATANSQTRPGGQQGGSGDRPLYELRSAPAATEPPPPASAGPTSIVPPAVQQPTQPVTQPAPSATPAQPAAQVQAQAQAQAGRPPATPAGPATATPPPAPVTQPTPTPTPASAPPPSVPPTSAPGAPAAPPVAVPTVPVATDPAGPVPDLQPVTLVFDPQLPTSVAVYERAGFLYVMFDREVPPTTMPQVDAPGLVGAILGLTHSAGNGYRLPIGPVLEPVVSRDGTAWRITLRRPGEERVAGLAVEPDTGFALGARLLVRAEEVETVIEFTDPVVGDRLWVVPLPAPGNRIASPVQFREAQFLQSAQGIVVRGLDDRLIVQPVDDGLEVGVPGGLALSPAEDIASAQPPPPVVEEKELFDYAAWGLARNARDFNDRRQRRWSDLIDLPQGDRPKGWMDLARFYVANGRGFEALGALQLAAKQQEDLKRRAEFLAVRGAAQVLTDDRREALADLQHRTLAEEPDAALWRAGAMLINNAWKDAHDLFTANSDRLMDLPDPLFERLGLMALEAAIKAGDTAHAAPLLKQLQARYDENSLAHPAIQYFAGELARQQGDLGKAKRIWAGLEKDRNRLYRTLATRDLIGLQLETGEIDAKRAAKLMERLRFEWRGDDIEFDIQRKIGDTHLAAQNYVDAFETMKRTVSLFPNHPQSADVTRQLRDTVADLFAKDGAAHLPALDALSLYETYKELTPPADDPRRNRIIQALAERMVELDLLDRAGGLLEDQVKNDLAGLEKAQTGTRLAGIRLLDHKPELAIRALDRSEVRDIPPELAAERRLLRARALSEMGKGAQAVQLLAQDDSKEAKLLRIDIAWREKQWGVAAQAIAALVGPPPADGQPLDQQQAKLIVNRAVALSLSQDSAGLAKLRQEFGPAMEKSREASAFRVLTRPEEATGLLDAASIQARMAETDMFRDFLDSYRAKQETAAPPPAAQPGPAEGAQPVVN